MQIRQKWIVYYKKKDTKRYKEDFRVVYKFLSNCKTKGRRHNGKWGPLTTEEIENADKKLIRIIQLCINLESKEAQELCLTLCDEKKKEGRGY